MTYGDNCAMFLPIVRTRLAQICGHSEKVHGAEADRLQLVLKKKSVQAHQSFTFDSDEAWPNGAVAENLGACHQDYTFKY